MPVLDQVRWLARNRGLGDPMVADVEPKTATGSQLLAQNRLAVR